MSNATSRPRGTAAKLFTSRHSSSEYCSTVTNTNHTPTIDRFTIINSTFKVSTATAIPKLINTHTRIHLHFQSWLIFLYPAQNKIKISTNRTICTEKKKTITIIIPHFCRKNTNQNMQKAPGLFISQFNRYAIDILL